MKIFLVGATGRTGQWILKTALERRFEVTALVRGTASCRLSPHPSLRVIFADLFAVEDLAGMLGGHDAVLSALSSDVVAAGTRSLASAAERSGVRRFLGVAGGGILQLDEKHLRRERPGYPAIFLKSSEGHLEAWRVLEKSSLLWTLVCTPDLVDSPAAGLAKHREDYMPEGGMSVPCGDVAEFMMGELEAARFPRKRIGLTV